MLFGAMLIVESKQDWVHNTVPMADVYCFLWEQSWANPGSSLPL